LRLRVNRWWFCERGRTVRAWANGSWALSIGVALVDGNLFVAVGGGNGIGWRVWWQLLAVRNVLMLSDCGLVSVGAGIG
jgi:hypothetical protein